MNENSWVFQVITIVFTLATPFLAWWGSSRYFAGQWAQYQRSSEEWRVGIGKRLDTIDAAIQSGAWPAVMVRLARSEEDISDLRRYKHETIDPYIRALDVQRSEIDQLKAAFLHRPSMRTRSDD